MNSRFSPPLPLFDVRDLKTFLQRCPKALDHLRFRQVVPLFIQEIIHCMCLNFNLSPSHSQSVHRLFLIPVDVAHFLLLANHMIGSVGI